MLQANNIKKLLIALNLVMAPIVAHAQLVGGTDTAPLGGLAIGYAQNDANGGIAIGSQHQGMGYTSIQGAAYYSTVVGTGQARPEHIARCSGQAQRQQATMARDLDMAQAYLPLGEPPLDMGRRSQATGQWPSVRIHGH